jgi:hypothetical protein
MLRLAVPVLTLQPPVLQNNRKVPESSCNRQRSQPNLWQLAGIQPAKSLLFAEFCEKFPVLRRKSGETGSHMTAHTTIQSNQTAVFRADQK